MTSSQNTSNKYDYLAKNTILFAISSFGSKILTFLLVPLYTNVLTKDDYGIADLVITTANLLMFIFTLEISSAVLRFAIDRKTKQGEILSFGFKIVVIGSCILFIILLLVCYIGIFALPLYFYIFLYIFFVGSSINNLLSSYLRAIDDVFGCAVAGIISTFFMLSGNLLALLVLKAGIMGYLVSLVISPFISNFYMIIRVFRSKTFSIRDKCCSETQKEMIKYSSPLIFNGIGWWINNSLDKYFLIGMIDTAANGIYAAALKIPTILSVFQTIFSQAWNLSAIKEFDNKDKQGFFITIYNSYNAGFVILSSFLVIINIPLAHILFAKEFFSAWRCSSILLISALFSALAGFLGSIFTAVKKSSIFAYSTISTAFINIILNYFMIKYIGIEGAAISTSISFFIMWIIRMICVKRVIILKINLIRDFFAYSLLCIQIVFDHFDSHIYFGQALIFIFLFVLYFKEIKVIVQKVSNRLLSLRLHRS